MPQLDPSSFPTQLIWLAISFVILFLLMSRVALPRIADVLERRRQRIDGDLEKAESLKEEAEAVREAYEKAIEEARTQAHAKLVETAASLALEAAERHRALAESLGLQVKEAEQRIAAARDQALENVLPIAAEVAGAATEKLIGTKIGEKSVTAAVDTALRKRD